MYFLLFSKVVNIHMITFGEKACAASEQRNENTIVALFILSYFGNITVDNTVYCI